MCVFKKTKLPESAPHFPVWVGLSDSHLHIAAASGCLYAISVESLQASALNDYFQFKLLNKACL